MSGLAEVRALRVLFLLFMPPFHQLDGEAQSGDRCSCILLIERALAAATDDLSFSDK